MGPKPWTPSLAFGAAGGGNQLLLQSQQQPAP